MKTQRFPSGHGLLLFYLCLSSQKGVSSLQIHRQLGITQKTAWFLLHRIREMLKDKAPQMLRESVQIDETYVGGLNKNKHKSKLAKLKEQQGGKILRGVVISKLQFSALLRQVERW
jgi:hypothetical protein